MGEWKLVDEPLPYQSTYDFHAGRERAPHLEQAAHQPRLQVAAELIFEAAKTLDQPTLTDLGCGDGGLLSVVQHMFPAGAWGYDFQPSNAAGWKERGVTAWQADVFGVDRYQVRIGDVVVCTEVLEHLADPHGALRWIRSADAMYLVCSSPRHERPGNHSPEHVWAWDEEGYAQMLVDAGWAVHRHVGVDQFQVVLAARSGRRR